MPLHPNTFDYLKPTEKQIETIAQARFAADAYASKIDELMPDGPDKTYALRLLRTVAMWVNVAITREASGAPRDG